MPDALAGHGSTPEGWQPPDFRKRFRQKAFQDIPDQLPYRHLRVFAVTESDRMTEVGNLPCNGQCGASVLPIRRQIGIIMLAVKLAIVIRRDNLRQPFRARGTHGNPFFLKNFPKKHGSPQGVRRVQDQIRSH